MKEGKSSCVEISEFQRRGREVSSWEKVQIAGTACVKTLEWRQVAESHGWTDELWEAGWSRWAV